MDDTKDAITYLEKLFEKGADGHGTDHALRVLGNAMRIAEGEKCDLQVVKLAALLHDADDHKLFQTKNNENARKFLAEHGVDEEKTERIIEAINSVSFSKNGSNKPKTVEGRIVQDADRLDAMGAVGVARTFAYGGSRGRSLQESIAHFHEKLLLLYGLMNTETGRLLARERHEFLLTFLKEWERETTAVTPGKPCFIPAIDQDAAILALKKREKDLVKYQWIMEKFATGDCGAEFRRKYCGFYRVRRDRAWQEEYFGLMDRYAKREGVAFGEILLRLWQKTGRLECSFASKMLATLDDSMPIWDGRVLSALSLKLAGKTPEEKLSNAVLLYERIVSWYGEFQKTEQAFEMVRRFDEAFPGLSGISRVKKIDFFLWAGKG